MDVEDTPAPLLQLKAMIWIQSVIGAALIVAFLGCVLFRQEALVIGGIVLCGVFWLFGFVPIREKARALQPAHRVEAKGLPPLVTLLVGLGVIMSVATFCSGPGDWSLLVVPFNMGLAGTILLRVGISQALNVPLHRPTWGFLLGLLTLVTGWQSFILVMILEAAGC